MNLYRVLAPVHVGSGKELLLTPDQHRERVDSLETIAVDGDRIRVRVTSITPVQFKAGEILGLDDAVLRVIGSAVTPVDDKTRSAA